MKENDNMELEQMKEQLSVLKSKLDKEDIVNDRLMRKVMRKKVSRLKRYTYVTYVAVIIGIPYCTWACIYLLNISLWFTLFTDLFFLIALVYTYLSHRDIRADDLMEGNLLEVSMKIAKMKKLNSLWLRFSIPFAVVWMAWFFMEISRGEYSESGIIGGTIGAVIGLAVGVMMFRKHQRAASEIIQQIKELEKDK